MAAVNVDNWIREEHDSSVVRKLLASSAVEALGRRVPMGTNMKSVNRAGDVDVTVTPKHTAYNEVTPDDDEVTLTARKFTALIRIAEEDVADLPASGVTDYVRQKQEDWASSYARALDNAALGVTAAENGTTVPFTSVYKLVNTSDAGLGYTAGDNLIVSPSASPVSYDELSQVLALAENGEFYDASKMVVIAHPSFLGKFRDVKDNNGNPIFAGNAQADGSATLFGLPVRFSQGARTSATMSKSPTGNPLLIVANRDMLILGVRSGPEYAVISGWDGASAVTDEALIKMRARRGFAGGHPGGFAVLEDQA